MAGQSGEPLVVILNDNGMSINASMGGVAQHLAKQRLKPQYLWAKEIYRKVMHATDVYKRQPYISAMRHFIPPPTWSFVWQGM